MTRVLIDDENTFYRDGLWHFIKQHFALNALGPVELLESSEDNLNSSDIIVKVFQNGAASVCHYELLHRKGNSLLIGVCTGEWKTSLARLPDCLKGVLFIKRNESLKSLSKKIILAWKNSFAGNEKVRHCHECQALYFSSQEEKVVRYICSGFSVARIAWILSLNIKTISSHKRSVMHKFNLNSDAELLALMKSYEDRLTYSSGRKRFFYMSPSARELNIRHRIVERLIHTVAI